MQNKKEDKSLVRNIVKFNGEQTKLVGKSEEGSIVIALKAGETDLIAAESFVVSWEHEGHTDTGYCQNLKLLKKPNPES